MAQGAPGQTPEERAREGGVAAVFFNGGSRANAYLVTPSATGIRMALALRCWLDDFGLSACAKSTIAARVSLSCRRWSNLK